MQSPDPVHVARALFEAFRSGDESQLLALTHDGVEVQPLVFEPTSGHRGVRAYLRRNLADSTTVEAHPHRFERLSDEDVLVTGRLRILGRGLRDSPAYWVMTIRDGLWVAGRSFRSEAEARAALSPAY